MSAAPAEEPIEETGFLGGKVLLRQLRRGHRAGTDAALVVAAAKPYATGLIVDLGAGVGAIGLSLAVLVPRLEVALIENDPLLAGLATAAAAANGCAARLRVHNADVRRLAKDARKLSLAASADLVAMNPPFTNTREHQASPDAMRASAHVMRGGELPLWIGAAHALLKPKGRLLLIHRPESLGDLLAALGRDFGSVALRPVHPRADEAATRILLAARKGGRAPLTIAPSLALHEAGGAFTPLADAIHRGEAELPFP